ncbi:small secreted protein [Streptomyces chiangmaiensis]|uniref:Small secreted protein n=1 Tax=Streptomyces chiangmaiensis TaxID=766497 RepID=A0ABU7FFN9_9ACTN|nr:small secreted protein [Streptomyces chiangmaiensis]MED7822883.1 small secreted protein [Streptomyces chiangmaiensis]
MEGTDPVNKKLAVALSGGAVLVLALSGCTSGSGAVDDKLVSWAKQVCVAVQPQAKKIAAASAAIQKETSDNSTPEQVQKTDSQAFRDMADAYRAIGAAVEKAGAPDVGNGATKQKNAVQELNGIATAYGDLQKQVDGLDTKDQAKFADGLKGIATKLDTLSKSGNDALKELEAGDVGEAMSQQASCKAASASASPTAG